MPIKEYGIYIAWPPQVDLRAEGLGRHLAMFLKGASNIENIRFTVVCPSWSRSSIEYLAKSEQLESDSFDILAPVGEPYVLRIFQLLRKLRTGRTKREGLLSRVRRFGIEKFESILDWWLSRIASVHSFGALFSISVQSIILLLCAIPLILLCTPVAIFVALIKLIKKSIVITNKFCKKKLRALGLKGSIKPPLQQSWVTQLFHQMQTKELDRMQVEIDKLSHVQAWYCPTAFWPEFNKIEAPRLMCVPDVVLSDFPASFSQVGGDYFLRTFEVMGRAIRGAQNFVTYSDSVKWNTLVDRYGIRASQVTVIPHAPMELSEQIRFDGVINTEESTIEFCQKLLLDAIQRSGDSDYFKNFKNGEIQFIFYASQFRPNKNVITLLRAFEFLLRSKFLGHKLIMTGHPGSMPEIKKFIQENRLERDVLFLHGLSVAELSACYKLAQLAVNPSLSEGGCPFTFTEALSVGTPVVMSRIAVTEEVLKDDQLQIMTLFDPYDWKDCASRIEWAIDNRELILETQLAEYQILRRRTWTEVVSAHVHVLDHISK